MFGFGSPEKKRAKKIEKIGKLLEKGKLEKVLPFAKDDDPEVRRATLKLLEKSDDDAAFSAIVGGLKDRDLSVRMGAVEAIVEAKNKKAIEFLRHAYGPTSEPAFVEACKNALSALHNL